MTMPGPDQPLVVGNDWSVLDVPELGVWEPTVQVSVVIPAHDPVYLPWVLAALAEQSYPGHLFEVVVADDGSNPPVVLPEIRPERTRVVRVAEGWGRAAACHAGAEASDGEVIHWLDSDMVCAREEVEAQLRWHHVIDYAVVLGHKLFTSADALAAVPPGDLATAVARGQAPWLLSTAQEAPHVWVEEILEQTRDLTLAGPRAMRAHVGASASVGRDLYRSSGGMPTELVLGEDIVLGYRLREAGGVFIPDREARSLHLGDTNVMRDQAAINRYNKPFITDLVPEFRGHRLRLPRSYTVPYVEVVAPAGGASYEDVNAFIQAQLSASIPDVVVTLVAPWHTFTGKRRAVLADPALDLRLLCSLWGREPRVRFAEQVAPLSDATMRLSLPGVGFVPAGRTLERLTRQLEEGELRDASACRIELPGGIAVLERSSRLARRLRVPGHPADALPRDDAQGFVAVADLPMVKQVRGLAPWGVS